MSSAASQPNLRLVSVDGHADAQWRARGQASLAVVKENRLAAAAGMDPSDPRWVLALQTRDRLQGSTLTPERREQLLKAGKTLGLRPFESNLVIAIVQDQARTGEELEHARPALRLMVDADTGINRGQRGECTSRTATWPIWFAAMAGAIAVAGLLIRWISGW